MLRPIIPFYAAPHLARRSSHETHHHTTKHLRNRLAIDPHPSRQRKRPVRIRTATRTSQTTLRRTRRCTSEVFCQSGHRSCRTTSKPIACRPFLLHQPQLLLSRSSRRSRCRQHPALGNLCPNRSMPRCHRSHSVRSRRTHTDCVGRLRFHPPST